MPNIQVIQPENAEGYLKEVYDEILESRGKIAEIFKIQSLNPRSLVRHMDLYMTLMYGKSSLMRAQREMIGVIVSVANSCPYCIKHHSDALNHYWKDENKIKLLTEDYHKLNINETDMLLCSLSDLSTKAPGSRKNEIIIKKLKKNGLPDKAILDASMIVSYFNFVNRIALLLNVEIENNAEGYKY